MKIGLFYGSTTCYTEMAAEKIQAQLNSLFDEDIVDLHNIKDVNLTRTAEYDIIIFGISTWDFGELQEPRHAHPHRGISGPHEGRHVAGERRPGKERGRRADDRAGVE